MSRFPFLALACLLLWIGCGEPEVPAQRAPFDGEAAFVFLQEQVAFGPRSPGSAGHEQCRLYLTNKMAEFCDSVSEQSFTYLGATPPLTMTNILGTRNPSAPLHILLGAHWDTRPRADRDPDPSKRSQPILGANDGASGVAVLLELARELKAEALPYRVTFALLDGEDYGVTLEQYFLGSKYYAQNLPEPRPKRGIIVDMVGDADLALYQEPNSRLYAPSLVDAVWSLAAQLGMDAFVPQQGEAAILDDHMPLNAVGIPTIDIIDFDYPYWHTTMDTVDKCSPASLRAVGSVLLAGLRRGGL